MTNLQVLLLILGFLVLTVGSFVWYVATWNGDAAAADPIPLHLAPKTHGKTVDIT